MTIDKWITEEELHKTSDVYDKRYDIYCHVPIYEELSDDKVSAAIDILVRELAYSDYIICGDTHQALCIPIFDYNKYLMLSQRRWAEIMADAMNLREHTNIYTYLDFYLASFSSIVEKLPNKE